MQSAALSSLTDGSASGGASGLKARTLQVALLYVCVGVENLNCHG